jgi:hypothetical protein
MISFGDSVDAIFCYTFQVSLYISINTIRNKTNPATLGFFITFFLITAVYLLAMDPDNIVEGYVNRGYRLHSEDPLNRWLLLSHQTGKFRICNLPNNKTGNTCGKKFDRRDKIESHVLTHAQIIFHHKPTGGNKRDLRFP